MPPGLFALVILGIIYVGAGLDCDSLIYIFHIAGMTGMHHHTQFLLVEMESLNIFARLTSNHDPPGLCSPSS
jgi:hypothetical protein